MNVKNAQKCSLLVQGGLENAILLYKGTQKMPISLYKSGVKNLQWVKFCHFCRGVKFCFLVQGGGGQFWPFFLEVEFWQFFSQGGQVWFIFVQGGQILAILYRGSKRKIYLQGVPKRPFCFIGGLENGTFLYSTSLKCHFVGYGGLENASFLYRGPRKCCFLDSGSRKCFFLYRGLRKCHFVAQW